MKKLLATTVGMVLATAAFANDEVPEETVMAIMDKLEAMNCQMAPEDIELEDGGYELDDVICEGGRQFDIELDADLNETGRRAE